MMDCKTCPALAGFIKYWIEVRDFDHPLDLHSFKLKEIIFIKHIIKQTNVRYGQEKSYFINLLF